MDLSRDFGCFKSLNWRTDLPAGSDCDILVAVLGKRGFEPVRPTGPLRQLRTAEGHEVVLVPRTGRIQIRIHYLTPEHERRFKAEGIFCAIVRVVLGDR